MDLESRHFEALDEAEKRIFHADFCPYLELKEMLTDASPLVRRRFRLRFTNYYGLNVAGLTDAFLDRFFGILFGGNVIVSDKSDLSTILNELCSIPRKKGDCAMPYSEQVVLHHDYIASPFRIKPGLQNHNRWRRGEARQ